MYYIIALNFLLGVCASSHSDLEGHHHRWINPDTVDELNLDSYSGRWYQAAANIFVMETFEKNCQCVTAHYNPITDTSFLVHNYCTLGAPNGTANTIDGRGWQPQSSDPGKLMVQFASGGLPFPAPYWVLALGPIVNSKYCWAIVSDPLSLFLYILVRNVDVYETMYKTEIMALVKKLGFVGIRAPIDTYQGSDCKYEWMVEK